MKLSKAHVLTAIASIATAPSCTDNAVHFDESELLTDSIVTTDEDGSELSRTTFFHDQNGRDTLTITETMGLTTVRRTTYTPDGEVDTETITTDSDTAFTEYTTMPDGSKLTTTTARTADGMRNQEVTVTAQDSATHTTISTTTFANSRQKKSLSKHDENGNETEVTTWQRDSGQQTWEPISKLTYEYTDGKIAQGTYSTWAETKWEGLSSETYKYGANGLLTEKAERADEILVITTYDYDSAGNKTQEEQRTHDKSEGKEMITEKRCLKYSKMRKTEDMYSIDGYGEERSRLRHMITTTYYSPKPPFPQKGSQRN
ncbi:MAG: hypothetical protein ACI35Q_10415 [Marinilabiliaceae bacterium]